LNDASVSSGDQPPKYAEIPVQRPVASLDRTAIENFLARDGAGTDVRAFGAAQIQLGPAGNVDIMTAGEFEHAVASVQSAAQADFVVIAGTEHPPAFTTSQICHSRTSMWMS